MTEHMTDYIECRVEDCKYHSGPEETTDGKHHCELKEIIIEYTTTFFGIGHPMCKCYVGVPYK